MKILRLIGVITFALLAVACTTRRQLPPLKPATSITVEIRPRNHPAETIHSEIRNQAQIDAVVAFVNSQPAKWTVPWYGPPVGTIYFKFFAGSEYVGNFYVGPVFFGRDSGIGNFTSQRTTWEKIEELEKISRVNFRQYLIPSKAETQKTGKP